MRAKRAPKSFKLLFKAVGGVIGRVGSLAMQAASIPCVKQIASCNAGNTNACSSIFNGLLKAASLGEVL